MLLAREAEAVNDPLQLVLGGFDAFGNLDFLLAGQQGHLAHLLEVHAHRVVEDVQPALVLLFLRFGLLDAVDLGLVDDVDLEVAQLDVNLIQFVRRNDGVGQGVVDVVVGQVALFLRQAKEFLDLFGEIDARRTLERANRLLDLRQLGFRGKRRGGGLAIAVRGACGVGAFGVVRTTGRRAVS